MSQRIIRLEDGRLVVSGEEEGALAGSPGLRDEEIGRPLPQAAVLVPDHVLAFLTGNENVEIAVVIEIGEDRPARP